MRAFIVFSGTGPILIITTFASLTDPGLIAKLADKGAVKYIGYELPIDKVKANYGMPYEVLAADLEDTRDLRILDFNGHNIFSIFSFAEFGEAIKVEAKG